MRVVLSLVSPRLIRNARLAISIEDHLGRRITTAATYLSRTPAFDVERKTDIECQIERVLLGEGRYFITVAVSTKEAGLLDWAENTASFDVSWYDRYGKRRTLQPLVWSGPDRFLLARHFLGCE